MFPGCVLQAEGCRRASGSISAVWLAEENTHLVTLCHCVGRDTWSPAFFKAPSQSTFPCPPCRALWSSAVLFLDFSFALHRGESGERGLHCHPSEAAV